jgi:hypothetical protein
MAHRWRQIWESPTGQKVVAVGNANCKSISHDGSQCNCSVESLGVYYLQFTVRSSRAPKRQGRNAYTIQIRPRCSNK